MASKLRSHAARHTDEMLTKFYRVQELVAAQPGQEGPQERVRSDIPYDTLRPPFSPSTRRMRTKRLTRRHAQYQEAQDQQIPFAQGYRPQVQTQPQTCSSRHHESPGTWPSSRHQPGRHTDNLCRRRSRRASARPHKRIKPHHESQKSASSVMGWKLSLKEHEMTPLATNATNLLVQCALRSRRPSFVPVHLNFLVHFQLPT